MIRLDTGDIVVIGSFKLLIVGYAYEPMPFHITILTQKFITKKCNIISNYIDGLDDEAVIDKFLLNNIVFFYLNQDDGKYVNIGLDLMPSVITQDCVVGKIGKQELEKFLLKQKLLNRFPYDIKNLVTSDYLVSYALDYKYFNYIEKDIDFVLGIERTNFKHILEKPRKDLKVCQEDIYYIAFDTEMITFSKRYMYLYQVTPNFTKREKYYFVGRALLSNEEECFKLYLKSKNINGYIKESVKDIKGESFIFI